jgi:hypothetical protein
MAPFERLPNSEQGILATLLEGSWRKQIATSQRASL